MFYPIGIINVDFNIYVDLKPIIRLNPKSITRLSPELPTQSKQPPFYT